MTRNGAPARVIALHGFTQTGASWQPVVAGLRTRRPETCVIAPTLRGHGPDPVLPATFAGVLSDLTELMDGGSGNEGDQGPVTLAGYSQGGRIALHAGFMWPERVERIVLIGASPGIADPRERAARRAADEALAAEIEAGTITTFAERWAQTPVLAGQPPEVLAIVHADRLRSTPRGLAAALRGLGTGVLPSLWDRLGELTVPVELIVGERDVKFRAVAEAMAGRLRAARLVTVPGAGHAVHLERPGAVVEVLAASSPGGAPPGGVPRGGAPRGGVPPVGS